MTNSQNLKGYIAVNKCCRSIIHTSELKLFSSNLGSSPFHTIIFSKLPKFGRIIRFKNLDGKGKVGKGRSVRANDQLSKSDFDNHLILYQHSEENDDKEDSFEVCLIDKNKKMEKRSTCIIEIIEDNHAPVLVENHILYVQSGYHMTISKELLKVTDSEQGPKDLHYSISSPPKHGTIMLNNQKVKQNGTFSQKDINDELVSYVQNGENKKGEKESASDQFAFRVSDGSGGHLEGTIFRIVITECPFALLQNNPISVEANSQSLIKGGNLRIIHTGAKKPPIKYTLKKIPEKGSLLVHGMGIYEDESFTQEDIDNGALSFEHHSS